MTSLVSLEPSACRPEMVPGTYFVQTWGCQMNEEDSEQIGLYLEQLGFEPAESFASAQVVLLNTCSVRKKPEDKAFSLLGLLEIQKRRNPSMVIGVCGCMAQLRAQEIHRRAPHVDFVIGTGQLSEIPSLVQQAQNDHHFVALTDLPERKGSIVTDLPKRAVARKPKLKAYVPIQYGCDKFCTFCIVPTTRGRERSRSTAEILDEIKRLADEGTKEVTLLGQTVNSYGKNMAEGKVPFAELLAKVAEVNGIERIRFTSPYPRDFKPDLIQAIRDIPQVMEHVHMPIQAGSDSELRRMRRLYTRQSFGEIVAMVRDMIPGAGLSTDIIVGFPGETEAEFEATMDAVREYRFDNAYTFAYSPRPGTLAAGEPDQIDTETKKRRLGALIQLQREITLERHAEQIGKTHEVLLDRECGKPGQPMIQGHTRDFRIVHVKADASRIGRIARVTPTKAHPWGLSAELV